MKDLTLELFHKYDVVAQIRLRMRSKYNAGLKLRGSITFWLSTDVIEKWLLPEKTGRRGASKTYSDIAIATLSTIKSIFSLAGRQAQGFVESIFQLRNLNLSVPDQSTVSRRLGSLKIELPVHKSRQPRHLVVDSTGIKVEGEGEWKTIQHGVSKNFHDSQPPRVLHTFGDPKNKAIAIIKKTIKKDFVSK